MRRLTCFLVCLVFAASLPTAASAQDLLRFKSTDDTSAFLHRSGYEGVTVELDDGVSFTKDGLKYALYVFPDGDLQLFFGISGISPSLVTINAWNREYRTTTAYIDRNGHPILEADLLGGEGITPAQMDAYLHNFFNLSTRFVKHVQSA